MPPEPVELDDLGALRIRGADAERFLQGQLSSDLARLDREGSLLAGLHNPQGRTIALLRLLRLGEHDLLAVVPRELAAAVASRLARYVLRAQVRITDESAAWRVRGLVQGGAPDGLAMRIAGAPGSSVTASARWISVAPAAPGGTPATPHARRAWRLLDIAAGLPQVYARTSEQFVAQMLNLDAIDAISFSKGCYTGQEVIARAHYRGRVKRRMQRWRTAGPAALAPGDSARIADGRALRVVEAAPLSDGRCEFLAVAPLSVGADGDAESAAESGDASGGGRPAAQPAATGIPLEVESLSLPYGLPS